MRYTIGLIIASLLAAPAVAQTTLPFSDNFNDGAIAAGWTSPAGLWAESGGSLHGLNTAANTPIELYWKDGIDWANYMVEAKVRVVDGYEPADAQLNFLYRSSGNTCACSLFQGYLPDWGTGTFLVLSTPDAPALVTPFPYELGKFYRLRATTSGNMVSCEVMGLQRARLTAVLPGPASGTVALRNTHIRADFDNLTVRPVSSAEIAGTLDPSLPTLVFTHGLQGISDSVDGLWTGGKDFQASAIARYVLDGRRVNIVQYNWRGAYTATAIPNFCQYSNAQAQTVDAGTKLAKLLINELGLNYNQRIQLVGHSLGTAVNGHAARILLDTLTSVPLLQYTALDRPDHVDKLPCPPDCSSCQWNQVSTQFEPLQNVLEQVRYSSEWVRKNLPLCRDRGRLLVDNYYSSGVRSSTAVGDIALGPVMNHEPLVNPNDLDTGGLFHRDRIYSNDHSGVHQWYRWTMTQRDNIPSADNFCLSESGLLDPAHAANCPEVCPGWTPSDSGRSYLDQSLSPCENGWNLSILTRSTWPQTPGQCGSDPVRNPLAISDNTVAGCSLASTSNGVLITCGPQSSALEVADEPSQYTALLQAALPPDSTAISFEYRFVNPDAGGSAVLRANGGVLWQLSASSVLSGDWASSGPVELGSSGAAALSFELFDDGDNRVEVSFRNLEALTYSSNHPPIARAGEDQILECESPEGAVARLDGGASSDEDGDRLTFDWKWMTSTSTGEAHDATPQILLPVGTTSIELTVRDGTATSDPDSVTVVVSDTTAPSGKIVSPVPGLCTSSAVSVVDDHVDACTKQLHRAYSLPGGPTYTSEGNYFLQLAVTDEASNVGRADVSFTIDKTAPVTRLEAIPISQRVPQAVPLSRYYSAKDDDAAQGGVVHERVLLDECVVLDGTVYGNRDGLLSDESVDIGGGLACDIFRACGKMKYSNPVWRIEASDCANNVGNAEIVLPGVFAIDVEKCK